MAVLGIDACKRGWIGIVLDAARPLSAFFGRTLIELQSQVEIEVGVVAIDMPIGLPRSCERAADVLAKAFVGSKLQNSVFMTPPEAVLQQSTYRQANEVAVRLCGRGISQQAYALRAKIFEVAAWASTASVYEVHPEVSFREMAGSPLKASKKSWSGFHERSLLLKQHGLRIDAHLGAAGTLAAVDDVLDAAAAAWTAQRIREGVAVRLPEAVASDTGTAPAIWA